MASTASSSSTSGYNTASSKGLFFLKAELSTLQQNGSSSRKRKGYGDSSTTVSKKASYLQRPNKGVSSRNASDLSSSSRSMAGQPNEAERQRAMEKKTRKYELLQKGLTGGLSEKERLEGGIDWERKLEEGDLDDTGSSSSSNEDESLTVPQKPTNDEDDPLTEYTDEYGRSRWVPRSEVPVASIDRARMEQERLNELESATRLIHGDQGLFPVYEQTSEERERLQRRLNEDVQSAHYDASQDNRKKAAGFYSFSKDEEERERQMRELKEAREETERIRAAGGEGGIADGSVLEEGAAMEKKTFGGKATRERKDENDDRKRMIAEMRAKKAAAASGSSS